MEFTKKHEEQIQETHDIMVAMQPMIENHDKTLYGNGREGLAHRVTVLEAGKKTMLAMLGIGMFVVAVLSLIVSYFKK